MKKEEHSYTLTNGKLNGGENEANRQRQGEHASVVRLRVHQNQTDVPHFHCTRDRIHVASLSKWTAWF